MILSGYHFLVPLHAEMKRSSICLGFSVSLLLFMGLTSCSPHSEVPEQIVDADSVVVLEYRPAMGQFVNVLPKYEDGDTHRDMCRKAERALRDGSVITLGGFGGYVTLTLGTPILNNPHQRDFQVLGNAFLQQGSDTTGNSEPGIVLVSLDDNNNGLPDDTWYELAGSEYYKPETKHDYHKTWCKSDTTLLNPFHKQPYFPQWLSDTVISVSGTLLAPHTVVEGGVIAQRILDYGYADNKPNTDTLGTAFDLDWAVDDEGNPVELPYCDFIRIQTAVDEVYSMIGELSTEVSGMKIMNKQ